MVADPPSFVTEGPTERYVLLGEPLSLVCGTGLDSNPQATITWTAPDGTTIVDNNRYDLENGPAIVRLNFTNTIMTDSGLWQCMVTVTSGRYIVSGGDLLVFQDQANIGSITREIQLIVIGELLFVSSILPIVYMYMRYIISPLRFQYNLFP
jgi:hypothetical protein